MRTLITYFPTTRYAEGSLSGSQPTGRPASAIPRWLALACLAVGVLPANANTGHAETLDPGRIGWSNLSYRATKLLFSVDADISIAASGSEQITGQLMESGDGQAIAPADEVRTLVFQTELFGRSTTATLIVNSDTGAALQRTSHDSGKRYRHRIYRYTDIGAYNRTRWPVGAAEEQLPAEQWAEWSEAGEGMTLYPDTAVSLIVTDPGGLLYIIGAAPLDEPGDVFVIHAYVRGHVHRVEIEVAGFEPVKLSYTEQGETSVLHEGTQEALKLLIRGEGLDDGDSENEFDLLGLRGDIVMHIDPRTRAPLQIEGRVKIAGHTIMRLRELVLNGS